MSTIPSRRPWWSVATGVVLLWSGLVALLVVIGRAIVHSGTIGRFDLHIATWIMAHRTPWLDSVMRTVTWLGSWWTLVAVGIALVVLVASRRLPPRAVALAALALIGGEGATHLVKGLVHRDRPPAGLAVAVEHGWSFPSGHATTAALVACTGVLVAQALGARPAVRWTSWAVGGLMVVVVACSRVVLGVHWTSDVLASVVFVAVWSAGLWLVVRRPSGPGHRGPPGSRTGPDPPMP